MNEQATETPGRRRFLRSVISVCAGLIASITLIPGVALLLQPAFSRARRGKRKIIFQNPEDAQSSSFITARYEGQEEAAPGIYIRKSGQQYTVLSARCTHASCAVAWNPGAGQFVCPCHGGRFDENGKNVSGPPPRPLDRLSVTKDGADLLVEEPES